MRAAPGTVTLGGAVLGLAIVAVGCGAPATSSRAAQSSVPPAPATASPTLTALPTGIAQAPPPSPGTPSLSGVAYVVPPGWQVATPSPAEADLSSESGLGITLRAVSAGSPPAVTAANGSRITVDGTPGYQSGGAGSSGYLVQVTVAHAGTLYEMRCTGPGAQDVHNVCDGFVLSLHWVA